MKVMKEPLNKLAELCMSIANYVDRQGEDGNVEMCDELGLGYLTLSSYLRNGVKAIVDIQMDYSKAKASEQSAKECEQDAMDFLEEIFGDREINCINETDKERIKEFVHNIQKEWEERYEE